MCFCVCFLNNILLCSFLSPQLLALTIQQEKPELESEKTRLLQQEEDKKIQLAQLEESLLEVHEAQSVTLLLSGQGGSLTRLQIYSFCLMLFHKAGLIACNCGSLALGEVTKGTDTSALPLRGHCRDRFHFCGLTFVQQCVSIGRRL